MKIKIMNRFIIYFSVIFSLTVQIKYTHGQKEFEKQLESNFPCNHDADCKTNSFCTGNTVEYAGRCVCDRGYLIQKNGTDYKCYPEGKQVGDPCELDIQCQYNLGTLAKCQSHKCRCEGGAHDWKNECYRTSRLGEPCRYNENCVLRGDKIAYCLQGKCECGPNMIGATGPGGDFCMPAATLGEPCYNNVTCKPLNSQCVKICRCKIGYTTNIDETSCLPIASKLNDTCEEDVQCEHLPETFCFAGKCQCKTGNTPSKNSLGCEILIKPGQACYGANNCGPNAKCVKGSCECLNGVNKETQGCNNGNKISTSLILLIFMTIFIFYSQK